MIWCEILAFSGRRKTIKLIPCTECGSRYLSNIAAWIYEGLLEAYTPSLSTWRRWPGRNTWINIASHLWNFFFVSTFAGPLSGKQIDLLQEKHGDFRESQGSVWPANRHYLYFWFRAINRFIYFQTSGSAGKGQCMNNLCCVFMIITFTVESLYPYQCVYDLLRMNAYCRHLLMIKRAYRW